MLRQEGYTVEAEPSDGRVGQYRPDLIARRGDETTVYEVKVLGGHSQGKLVAHPNYAREHKARFKLVLVRPQRETGIEVEAAPDMLLKAVRKSDRALLLRLGSDVDIERVDDADFDTASLRHNAIELKGSAVAIASRRSGRENMAEQLTLTLDFRFIRSCSEQLAATKGRADRNRVG